VPVAGAISSQEVSDEDGFSCQYSALPPALAIVTTWAAGLPCPCITLKLRLDGAISSTGITGGVAPFTGNVVLPVGDVALATGDASCDTGPDCSEEGEGERDKGTIAPGVLDIAGSVWAALRCRRPCWLKDSSTSAISTHSTAAAAIATAMKATRIRADSALSGEGSGAEIVASPEREKIGSVEYSF
jgi:hypothetical protein